MCIDLNLKWSCLTLVTLGENSEKRISDAKEHIMSLFPAKIEVDINVRPRKSNLIKQKKQQIDLKDFALDEKH